MQPGATGLPGATMPEKLERRHSGAASELVLLFVGEFDGESGLGRWKTAPLACGIPASQTTYGGVRDHLGRRSRGRVYPDPGRSDSRGIQCLVAGRN